jgi:LacI family transcriptional regulator
MSLSRNVPRVLLILDPSVGYDRRVLTGIGHYSRVTPGWDFRNYQPSEMDLIRNLIENWQPTGIISRFKEWDEAFFQRLIRAGTPVVEVDALIPGIPIPQVYTDAGEIVQLFVDHMMQLGLGSFGYLEGASYMQDKWRLEKFQDLSRSRGFKFSSFRGEIRRENDPTLEFDRWLRERPRPAGLLCSSAWIGWHVIASCLNAGFNVPDEFAVMSVNDDQPWSELVSVPMSSVVMAAEKIGYRAASLLDQMMRGVTVSTEPIVLPPVGIIARRSTDVIAAEEPEIAQVLRYIADHAAEGCTMKDVLRAVPADRRRVERWFNKNLGRSPFKEIQRIRVTHVKKLLAETDESMIEIARRTGFATAKLLSRAFHREAGMTLLQYRKQFFRSARLENQ